LTLLLSSVAPNIPNNAKKQQKRNAQNETITAITRVPMVVFCFISYMGQAFISMLPESRWHLWLVVWTGFMMPLKQGDIACLILTLRSFSLKLQGKLNTYLWV